MCLVLAFLVGELRFGKTKYVTFLKKVTLNPINPHG
jgi:hypothetical protein